MLDHERDVASLLLAHTLVLREPPTDELMTEATEIARQRIRDALATDHEVRTLAAQLGWAGTPASGSAVEHIAEYGVPRRLPNWVRQTIDNTKTHVLSLSPAQKQVVESLMASGNVDALLGTIRSHIEQRDAELRSALQNYLNAYHAGERP